MSRLRLREVRLSGFKTFADKTTIAFTPGITAIVGPNGSGKSNIVDALRWALGEAGRGIRSKRVDEVIFAGSEKRRQLGLAEVSLSIANDDGLFDLPFTEIEIARRADRGGGQEYLLNRERIRLRDLNELLDGAGLAENGLLFIGQGAVDQALSLRAEERRALVEEFAGTARHERRRARAESEMKEATENRARVEEILAALRPQERRLATLARQEAGRDELLSEAVDRIATLGAQRAGWFATRRIQSRTRLSEVGAEIATVREALRSADGEAQVRRVRLAEARLALEAARQQLEAARTAREAAERNRARSDAEAAAVERDTERLSAEVAAAEREVFAVEQIRATPAPAADAEAAAALELLDADLATARRELRALSGEGSSEAASGQSLLRAERSRSSELAETEARILRSEAELEAVDADRSAEDLIAATGRRDTAAAAYTEAAGRLERATAAATAAEAAEAKARALVGDRDSAARAAEAESATLQGRLSALEARRTALQERALARAARAIGGRSLLAGVEIREEGRSAVLAALGALARGFIVDRSGATLLDDEQGALLIEGVKQAAIADHPTLPRLSGEILNDPDGILQRILAGVAVAPSVASALDALQDLPAGGLIVTRGGAVIRAGGLVTRETESEDALLDTETARLAGELERRSAASAALRAEADAEGGRLAEAIKGALTSRAADLAARSAMRSAADLRAEAERELAGATRKSADRETRLQQLSETLRDLRARRDQLQASAQGATSSSGAAQEWQDRIRELTERRGVVSAAVEADRQALRTWEIARARGDASVAAATARIARAAEERGALESRSAALQVERSDLVGRSEAAQVAVTERERLVQTLAEQQEAIERESAADEERKRTLRSREAHLDEALRPLERDAQGLEFEYERLIEELSGDLAAFGRRLADDARIAAGIPAHLRASVAEPTEGELTDAAGSDGNAAREAAAREQAVALLDHWGAAAGHGSAGAPSAPDPEEIRTLERLRRKIGPLDAGGASVAIEHRELRDRLESLEAQTVDLDGAIAKASELMNELDTLVESTFAEQFTALQTSFSANFQLLFGGGDAQLRLAAEDGVRRPGVEIDARPPLKRRQQLSLLSGGERALTGVALLLGMLAVRPLPFVVLDEVDAALDEANVTRFGDAIRELSERTQVIVITHNRGTVEVADSLWGVTAGEDAASRVFGLRLDEAKKIADAARAERAEREAIR
ncbi:MAG: chromosome segregation protein SMC [Chloroflexi bacterium]|nr:chromosome segregation protein SMC [Chloroflexota bacterium]